MADIDWGATEEQLKKAAKDRGVEYDTSDLEDVKRNASYEQNQGKDPSDYFNQEIAKYDARANNAPHQEGKTWSNAANKTYTGPAQTQYTVDAKGNLTRRPGAPTPFTIPTFGTASTAPSAASAPAADRGTTRNPFATDPLQDADMSYLPNKDGLSPQQLQAIQQIAGAYNTYLGGQGTLEEYMAHLGGGRAINQANVTYALNNIKNSDEAKAYAAWKAKQSATPAAAAPASPATPSAPSAPSNPYSDNVNTHPAFDDPGQRLIEDDALNRYKHLKNPEADSGTGLYEDYLKQLADILKGAPFSDTEMAQLKNSVYQDLLTERDATQQRWLEEVSKRGLAPSSGPALAGLQQIDLHFEQLRSGADSQFALAAIQQRQQNQLQVANIYGTLAGSEEGRLDKAFQYANVPYGLFNDSFQRNLQLVGAGGSPGATISSVMGIVNAIQNNNAINSQNRAALTSGLLQYLGYLFPQGAGG